MKPVISAEELHRRLSGSGFVIIDCRFDLARPNWGREQYAAGHIPGAVYADLDQDLAAPKTPSSGRHPLPSSREAETLFRRLGVTGDSTVVVYDQGGGAFAARAWWMLRWLGHESVQVLDGGWTEWSREQYPVDTAVPSPDVGDFEAREQGGMVVTTRELAELLDEGMPVIDARDAQRFAGVTEPIDAVAGHIPGAVNLPFTRFLTERQTLISAEKSRRLWQEIMGPSASREWVAMCGSGVTACHLALTAELSGIRLPRLYAGSWSEWIRDPSRAVATDVIVPKPDLTDN